MEISTLVNPRQVILLTARAKGRDNVMALAWHTPVSYDPPMYAVAIYRGWFTCGLVRASKVFVVNFMPKSSAPAVLICGRKSGKKMDKFAASGLDKEEAEKVKAPRIKQALGYLECRTVRSVNVGDHVVFIAKVLKARLKSKGKRLFHLGGDRFTTTTR
ncbi:MAG: flavin reductase family protein [Patescibacteria group bacterium]|nr:flavin reductase family protein [Patescibacteria group bacterium]